MVRLLNRHGNARFSCFKSKSSTTMQTCDSKKIGLASKKCHHESVMVQVIKCMYNCDTTRKLNTRLRELSTTPKMALVLVLVTTPTTSAWLKHSNYPKLKRCGHQRSNSQLELRGTCSTSNFFEATLTGSFRGVRIPSVPSRMFRNGQVQLLFT